MPGQESFLYRVVVVTLAVILLAVVVAMLYGLFDPRVDNKDIFSVIGPAFQTIVGCFVGLVSGLVMRKREQEQPTVMRSMPEQVYNASA